MQIFARSNNVGADRVPREIFENSVQKSFLLHALKGSLIWDRSTISN